MKRLINFLKQRYAPRGSCLSFSSTGEDLLMHQASLKLGISKLSYLDIGCHHPIFGNQTYLFYKKGARGVVVEPNQNLCNIIKKKRVRDICVCAGVGKIDTQATFYAFDRNTRSTFSKNQAKKWQKTSGQKYQIETIPLFSLKTIIKKYCNGICPDIISMDTEGYEEKILSGFSWKMRPKIFCVESDGNKKSLNTIFKDRCYSIYAETPANTIFIDAMINRH